MTQIWRDEHRETKRVQHFKGKRLLRLTIKERLKHGEKIPHRQQWVGKLPSSLFTETEKDLFKRIVCLCLLSKSMWVVCLLLVNRKVVWVRPFLGGLAEAGPRTKRTMSTLMIQPFVKCVEEIENRFSVKVQRVESDPLVFHQAFASLRSAVP